MPQTLPEGANISSADIDRIVEGLVELQTGKKAHAVVKVQVELNVHHEYPKFVTFKGSSKIVKSEAGELEFLSAARLADVSLLPTAADLDAVAKEQESVSLAAITGGQPPYAAAVDASSPNPLPPGLAVSIDGSNNLVVSGTPTTDGGPAPVLIDVTDSTGASVASVAAKV